LLLVAEQMSSDRPLQTRSGGRLHTSREARPGELRGYFDKGFAVRRAKAKEEGLVVVDSVASLDRILEERTPGIVLSAEGADFLEGDLGYVEQLRAQGLVHLQLVHFYGYSAIGDIATEPGTHGGLAAFGKDVVRTCNRLGLLVDVAHCNAAGMQHALDVSSKPIVYSHGFVSAGMPDPARSGARAIHAPIAKRLAQAGGVVGLWPAGSSWGNLQLYADGIARTVELLGAAHVGVGTDMHGLRGSIMPDYSGFEALEGELAKRGMSASDIEAVLGGNYIRVLLGAMSV